MSRRSARLGEGKNESVEAIISPGSNPAAKRKVSYIIMFEKEMKEIFVSRPTWVPDEYRRGLDGFLDFLKTQQISPRTLGATEYPSDCPLDEVIEIMEQCSGAIILGYPQLFLRAGKIKEKEIEEEVLLPTEWNHIEAGLAYARGLPLLVIHHLGVSRGIFDRGAISSFLYAIDFTDSAWFRKEEIVGAFNTWKADVLSGKRKRDSIPSLCKDPSFDDKTGTFVVEGDSKRYCSKCYYSRNQLIPLNKTEAGWRCRVCNEFYRNPNRERQETADNKYSRI